MTTVTGTFTFTPPVGPTGPAGPRGLIGAQGPQGAKGDPGPSPDINALATQVAAILASQTPVPTPTPVPSTGSVVVYSNGKFNWAGDFSWPSGIVINYADKDPVTGGVCGSVTNSPGGAGGWQPYAISAQQNLDIAPNLFLNFSVLATLSNQIFNVQFHTLTGPSAEVGIGNPLQVVQAKYGPASLTVGKWGTFKVPLSDLGITTNTQIEKFFIQDQLADQTGTANKWYFKDVYLSVA
jgi:hypothetical protein